MYNYSNFIERNIQKLANYKKKINIRQTCFQQIYINIENNNSYDIINLKCSG